MKWRGLWVGFILVFLINLQSFFKDNLKGQMHLRFKSATSRAYVQSSSNPLEIFHSLCKTPFTKFEPHRDNPSLEIFHSLNLFSEVRRREEEISRERDRLYNKDQSQFLIEYTSVWPRNFWEDKTFQFRKTLLIFWEDKTFFGKWKLSLNSCFQVTYK